MNNLLTYLNIAMQFRNHEFKIQLIRSTIFGGILAGLLVAYGTIVGKFPLAALVILLFGIVILRIWKKYVESSYYWTRFWEQRCRAVNDKIMNVLDPDINILMATR